MASSMNLRTRDIVHVVVRAKVVCGTKEITARLRDARLVGGNSNINRVFPRGDSALGLATRNPTSFTNKPEGQQQSQADEIKSYLTRDSWKDGRNSSEETGALERYSYHWDTNMYPPKHSFDSSGEKSMTSTK